MSTISVYTEPKKEGSIKGSRHWYCMWSPNINALHAMARKMGLKPEWFKDSAMLPHYELSWPIREKAIENGVIELSLKEYIANQPKEER